MIEIREIQPPEYGILPGMLYQAIYVPDGDERPAKTIVDSPLFLKYAGNFGRSGDFGYILLDGKDPVGAAWTRVFDKNNAGYGFIDEKTPELSIAIREKYRNRGFGRQLMQKLFDRLASEGFERLSLSVDRRNPAVRLYRRVGFEITAEAGTALTMVKKL